MPVRAASEASDNEHVRPVADPRDANTVEAAEPLADRQRVGEPPGRDAPRR